MEGHLNFLVQSLYWCVNKHDTKGRIYYLYAWVRVRIGREKGEKEEKAGRMGEGAEEREGGEDGEGEKGEKEKKFNEEKGGKVGPFTGGGGGLLVDRRGPALQTKD